MQTNWQKPKAFVYQPPLMYRLNDLLLVSCVWGITLWGWGADLWTVSSRMEILMGFMTEEGCKSDSTHQGRGYQPHTHTHTQATERQMGSWTHMQTNASSWQTQLWHQYTETWVKWFKTNTPTLLGCQQVCLTNMHAYTNMSVMLIGWFRLRLIKSGIRGF